jgi:hypothetical protein
VLCNKFSWNLGGLRQGLFIISYKSTYQLDCFVDLGFSLLLWSAERTGARWFWLTSLRWCFCSVTSPFSKIHRLVFIAISGFQGRKQNHSNSFSNFNLYHVPCYSIGQRNSYQTSPESVIELPKGMDTGGNRDPS